MNTFRLSALALSMTLAAAVAPQKARPANRCAPN